MEESIKIIAMRWITLGTPFWLLALIINDGTFNTRRGEVITGILGGPFVWGILCFVLILATMSFIYKIIDPED